MIEFEIFATASFFPQNNFKFFKKSKIYQLKVADPLNERSNPILEITIGYKNMIRMKFVEYE